MGGRGDLAYLRQQLENLVNELLARHGVEPVTIELRGECNIELLREAPVDGKCIETLNKISAMLSGKASRRGEGGEGEGERKNLINFLLDLSDCTRGFLVYGEYSCRDRRITLYLGCLKMHAVLEGREGALNRALLTLSHELIHHLQATGGSLYGGHDSKVYAEVRICDGSGVGRAIPYWFRPHECEARSKEVELAAKLRGDVGAVLSGIIESLL